MSELSDNQELEWTFAALARYLLPQQREWLRADGSMINFDRIVQTLLQELIGTGSCYGTHSVHSLCMAWRLDSSLQFLSPSTRASLKRRLLHIRQYLVERQQDNGAWPARWADGVEVSHSRTMVPLSQPEFQQLSSTSHHLDWIGIAPVEFRPPVDAILPAIEFFFSEMERLDDRKIDFFYIQFTHGIRGICGLAGGTPGVLLSASMTDLAEDNLGRLQPFE